jgi:hypothetical protein
VMPHIQRACSGASRIARVVLAMLSAPSSREVVHPAPLCEALGGSVHRSTSAAEPGGHHPMTDSDPTPGRPPGPYTGPEWHAASGPYLSPGQPVHPPGVWNGTAIAALVLSLLSLLLLLGLGILGLLVSFLVFTPLALGLSITAGIQVARWRQRGLGLAVTGFLLAGPGWLITAFLLW